MTDKSLFKQNKGTVIIYVLIISSIAMGIVFLLTSIFASKVKTALEFPKSITALYAADTGIEWRIYEEMKGGSNQPSFSNGASFSVETPFGSFPIKVIGNYKGANRSLEVSM